MSSDKRFMTRGLWQVLFNYLPDATFDYDRGSCICKVTELNLSPQVGIDRVQILQDIREYVKPWGDMTTLRPEDLKKPDLFTFGEPETVKFNVYPLTFKCVKCLSAFSYSNEQQFLSNPANRTCAWCGGPVISGGFAGTATPTLASSTGFATSARGNGAGTRKKRRTVRKGRKKTSRCV